MLTLIMYPWIERSIGSAGLKPVGWWQKYELGYKMLHQIIWEIIKGEFFIIKIDENLKSLPSS